MSHRKRSRLWLFGGGAFLLVEVAAQTWVPSWFFLVRNMHWVCFCIAFYHLGCSRARGRES